MSYGVGNTGMLSIKLSRAVLFVGVVFAALLSAGCSTPRAKLPEDSSWAYKVSMGTQVNYAGHVIKDTVSADDAEGTAEQTGYNQSPVAFSGAHALHSSGVPGMGALMVLDLFSTPATAEQAFFQHNTLAWFPADQASSPAEARDKFHTMRLEAIKNKLDALGADYYVKGFSLRKHIIVGGVKRTDNVIIRSGANDLCDSCTIVVSTTPPEGKPVMAPKELTGASFLAYRFAGSKEPYSRTHTTIRLKKPMKNRDDRVWIWDSRDFDKLNWLTSTYPDWAVEFVPLLKPERYKLVESGELPNENIFPFMSHKGEIKLFLKGK